MHLVFGVHGQLLRVGDLILGLFKREVEALNVPLYFFNPVDDFLLEDLLAVLQVFQLLLSLLGESSGGGVASPSCHFFPQLFATGVHIHVHGGNQWRNSLRPGVRAAHLVAGLPS